MPFRPGESGNPAGRPRGAVDKRELIRDLLVPHATELLAKAVAMALDGDAAMLRLCIDKLIGNAKPREPAINLSTFDGSLSERGEHVLAAMAAGEISPSEGSTVLGAIAAQAKLVELDDLIKRIEALEREHEDAHRAA